MTTSIPNQPNSGDPAEQEPAETASGTAPVNPEQEPAEQAAAAPGAEFAEQDLSQLAEFADYSNTRARDALTALQQTPDYEHLAAFLSAIREGFLVVDVTGTTTKKRGTRARTLRTAQGQLVLPIFTSMDELRLAVKGGAKANSRAARRSAAEPKGAVMPAREALQLISGDRFIAAEFDSGSAKQVLLRRYVELAAGDQPITAELLEGLSK